MLYFSYNDFMDYTENGEINKIVNVEEKIENYELKNVDQITYNIKNKLIEILKNKFDLRKFLKEFFNFSEIGDIENLVYYNNMKFIVDKEINNSIVYKIKDKEIFIFIKVIEKIDVNISYKMFESSLNIIKKWNKEEKKENKRYPIVVPIVIYIGREKWKKNNNVYNKINYIKYDSNRINFSYNMINVNELSSNQLKKLKSNIAKEFISMKNKYLQIN